MTTKLLLTVWTATLLFSVTLFSVPLTKGQETSSVAKLAEATDLRVPAGAIELRLQRKHVPNRSAGGPLGSRWRHNWESRLSRTAGGIRIEDWSGVTSFNQVGNGPEYTNASGERVILNSDGKATRSAEAGWLETYDNAGRLIERTYRQGMTVSLRYDAQGRLSRVEGSAKSFLSFAFDSAGRVNRVESSTGATARYAYDRDDLIEVIVNGGAPLRYGYDAQGALTKIDDPQSGVLNIAYDARGRETSYRWADGSEQRFEYDDAAKTRRVVSAGGSVTITREDSERRRTEITDPLGNKTAVQFDDQGRPANVTDPTGASSRISYDPQGRLLSTQDPLGRKTRYEYAANSSTIKAIVLPDNTRQEFEYDKDNNLSAVKIDGKTVGRLTYNADGSIASANEPGEKERKFTYYLNGLIKSISNALGDTTQFEYDARSNLIREINPLGGVTARSYDLQNRVVSETGPGGETIAYEYDSRGRVLRETNSAGATQFAYDALGRLIAETNPAGQVTRYEYNAADQLAKVIESSGQTETYGYDLAGNLTTRTDRLGRTTSFDYDPAGRVIGERSPGGLEVRYRYDVAGNLIGAEDSGGTKSEYQVDAADRTSLSTNPAGGKTQYRYDSLGNLVAVTDPLGHIRQFGYTGDGDLAKAAEPSRDEARYEYDAAGRVVAATRPSGGVSMFTYDAMGNLLTSIDPLGNLKRFSYDNAGRLLSVTDAAKRVTRYVYDKAGRQTEKQLPDGKRVTFKYDTLGRMIQADDGAFPVRIDYDQAGRPRLITYAAINKAVGYEYDAQGLRSKMIAPDGREVRYEYDSLKRLSALVLPDGKRIALSADEKNRIQSVTYPNGITGRWKYNTGGQISKISYQDSRGKEVSRSSYRYDAAGNAVEREDVQGQTLFAYDPSGQLIEETTSNGAIKYSYGSGGNRLRVEEGALTRDYKHNAADQLIQAGTEQLSYDPNGNLLSKKGAAGATTYEYDAENRLIKSLGADGTTTTYGYAPTGERVWRRDKQGITYFIYDGLSLIAELDESLRTKSTFVHGFGIDRPLAMLQGKQNYYYLADRLGSVTQLIDDKGEIAASYSYDAFGRIKNREGAVANPFAYTGRELDPTGLYYYRARYYDASLGRFLSNDLIRARLDEALEQNPYLYVRNSPVNFLDPLGLDLFSPEYLAGLTEDSLINLYKAAQDDLAVREEIYRAMRSQGMGTPKGDLRFYARPISATNRGLAWDPGSPPDLEGAPPPRVQQVVGRPGPAGSVNSNPSATADVPAQRGNPTGAVNGGSANRAGANTNAVRPAGGNTQQVGSGRAGGNTLRVAPSSAPAAGSGDGIWTLNPNTVRPSLIGIGTVAGLIATAADCYRNGLENCGPKIAQGVVIAGIAGKVLGKAAGPIATLVAGGKAWWEIGKEFNKDGKDQQQRDEQAKAREEQARVNLKNRDDFNPRIEQLRKRIMALRPHYETMINNTPKAQQQLKIAITEAAGAKTSLSDLGAYQTQVEDTGKLICAHVNQTQPATIKTDIERLAAQAEARMRESDNLLNQTRQLGANCRSAADANAIREKYKAVKSIPTAIARLKTEADRKNAGLEKLRGELQKMKGNMPAVATTDIADKALAADNAAKEATKLVTQMRDAMEVITREKSLRQEINALQSAVPESVLADIQDRFNELHALLSSLPEYRPLERYDDEALEAAKRANAAKEAAFRMLEKWSVTLPCQTDVPSADAAILRINTALTMAGLNDAGEFLRQAQVCEANAKCIPIINQARELIERLQIEEGAAAINQARQQGCNVTGLENTLDYYRSIRDGAALLFNAKERCKFQEGLAIAQKMPASIQKSPWIANGIEELRAGLAVQQQVERYITQATTLSSKGSTIAFRNDYDESRRLFAQADGFVVLADQLAAPYPCFVDRVNRYKDEYNRLKKAVNNNSGGKGATSGESTGGPTDELPGALGSGKSKQTPTDELPGALGSGKGKQKPTDDLPGALGSTKDRPPVIDKTEKPPSSKITIPKVMNECEGGFCGKWTLSGGNQFLAAWSNGAKATLSIEQFDDQQVVITRNDSGESISQNFSARYTGKLSGNSIVDGKVTFKQNGRTWSGTWSADW